jgi:hypothetical protein
MRQAHETIRMKILIGVHLRLLAALILSAACLHAAAIEGIVLNGTSGKPQPGATVTLYRLASATGPQAIESVKTDSSGKFSIDKELPGPRLLQAAYDGVTYNQMLPPGAPSNAVTINVFQSIKKPGDAHVDQHMMLLEPLATQLNVSETFVWRNDGKTTFNDPDKGTLEFYLPPGAAGKVEVNALAPQGMPIRRAAEKTAKPDIYKIDFPIKPGQSRIDLTYSTPFTSPGEFAGQMLYKGSPTFVLVPQGVTLAGANLQNLGPIPQNSNTTVYKTEDPQFKLAITGVGTLRGDPASGADSNSDQGGGQSISQIMPRLFQAGSPNATFLETVGSVKWILSLALAILALGFTLLYRAGTGEGAWNQPKAKSGSDRR